MVLIFPQSENQESEVDAQAGPVHGSLRAVEDCRRGRLETDVACRRQDALYFSTVEDVDGHAVRRLPGRGGRISVIVARDHEQPAWAQYAVRFTQKRGDVYAVLDNAQACDRIESRIRVGRLRDIPGNVADGTALEWAIEDQVDAVQVSVAVPVKPLQERRVDFRARIQHGRRGGRVAQNEVERDESVPVLRSIVVRLEAEPLDLGTRVVPLRRGP
jgi:hypothetical protein